MSGTVLFLGAGATKSVQGPLTDEILPQIYRRALSEEANGVSKPGASVVVFLQQEFHLHPGLKKEEYPSLPLLLSIIDMALDRRELFSSNWNVEAIAEIRQQIELGIFDVLEEALVGFLTNNHYQMLDTLFPSPIEPVVISTNYDLVVDTSLMFLSTDRKPGGGIPNYFCGLANMTALGPEQRFGTLLKVHGSLNWLYCRTCQRLELGATESTRFLAKFQNIVGRDLRSSLTADGAPCTVCQRPLQPLLVAPSHLKDYRNPHLGQIWYEAQRVLRQADSAVFVGYSLPDDDVEVVYLLKRGLAHIDNPKKITVVEYCHDNPSIPAHEHSVGRRYRALFGDIDWHATGLDGWLQTLLR
jgi:hypothetical protein